MRYPEIAKVIAARIHRGDYAAGDALPSETSLAAELGVARSTVRRALEAVERDQMLLSRQHGRWLVYAPSRLHAYDFTRPLMEWAGAVGVSAVGTTLAVGSARATAVEATGLEIGRGAEVLRVTRLVAIDDRPAILARATLPSWLAPAIESVPAGVRSLLDALIERADIEPGQASYRVSAVSANSEDGRLLTVPRSTPLVRLLRTARARDGRVFEFSDVRVRPDELSMVVHA